MEKVYIIKNYQNNVFRVFDSFESAEEYLLKTGNIKFDPIKAGYYCNCVDCDDVVYWNPNIPFSEMIVSPTYIYG